MVFYLYSVYMDYVSFNMSNNTFLPCLARDKCMFCMKVVSLASKCNLFTILEFLSTLHFILGDSCFIA